MNQFLIKKDPSGRFRRDKFNEDIKYRKKVRMVIDMEFQEALGSDCKFLFHGTPIWNAESIIATGEIRSFDESGEIYVSTISNVWFTTKHHADLLNYDFPAGCIFVIEPQTQSEFEHAKQYNQIQPVDFNKTPDRLRAVITTPENISRVNGWLKSSPAKIANVPVVDYFSACEVLSNDCDQFFN